MLFSCGVAKENNKPKGGSVGRARGPGEQGTEGFLPENRSHPSQGTFPTPGSGIFQSMELQNSYILVTDLRLPDVMGGSIKAVFDVVPHFGGVYSGDGG